MSTQPLEQAVSVARSILENVSADQLSAATPCASWDVSELINHMVGGQAFFTACVNGETPSGDSPDFTSGDFRAAFDEQSAACVAAFGAEGALAKMVTAPFGQMPGGAFMGLAITDTFQHAWDLAKATGQDTNLAPELATGLVAQAKANISENFRGPEGAPFAAEQTAGDDASPADQLAAFLGRAV
jgi:uncharacterized protein (TIGR03086 family)